MVAVARSCVVLAVSAWIASTAAAGCGSDNTGNASGQDSSVGEDSAATRPPGGSSSSGGPSGNTCLTGTAAQCFMASSVTCTGLGTAACQCSATCSGLPFTWSCGTGESCTAGSCASHCDVGCGGSACVAKCASQQSAVAAMQASAGGCGLFFESTSPFQSCQCAAGFDGGGSSGGGNGSSDGASGSPDVGASEGASDAPEGESGPTDASMPDASDAGSDASGNDSASNDSGSNDSGSNDAGAGDVEAGGGTDGPFEAAGDAGSCSASTSGGPPGSCQQIRTCGSRVYVANCTAQGNGTCAANGVATSTTYRCECGTPPAYLTTNGFSCAVLDAEGGVESVDCLGACGF